jgi:hypothetical protein
MVQIWTMKKEEVEEDGEDKMQMEQRWQRKNSRKTDEGG